MQADQTGFWFQYAVATGSIAASGTSVATLQMDQATDFRWIYTLGSCSLDADTDVTPNNFSVLMSIASGQQFSNNVQVPQRCFCGTAQHPLYLPSPVIIPANTQLSFNIVNLDAGNANTVTLVLCGYKIPRS